MKSACTLTCIVKGEKMTFGKIFRKWLMTSVGAFCHKHGNSNDKVLLTSVALLLVVPKHKVLNGVLVGLDDRPGLVLHVVHGGLDGAVLVVVVAHQAGVDLVIVAVSG